MSAHITSAQPPFLVCINGHHLIAVEHSRPGKRQGDQQCTTQHNSNAIKANTHAVTQLRFTWLVLVVLSLCCTGSLLHLMQTLCATLISRGAIRACSGRHLTLEPALPGPSGLSLDVGPQGTCPQG